MLLNLARLNISSLVKDRRLEICRCLFFFPRAGLVLIYQSFLLCVCWLSHIVFEGCKAPQGVSTGIPITSHLCPIGAATFSNHSRTTEASTRNLTRMVITSSNNNQQRLVDDPFGKESRNKFISKFCSERKLKVELLKSFRWGADIMRRAECARQSFRKSVNSPSAHFSTLTSAEKYYQRLRNNRKSAAASHLYKMVVSRELTTLLRRTSPENRDKLAKAITVHEKRCSDVENHINNLRGILFAEKEKYELTKALNTFQINASTDSHHQEMCKNYKSSSKGSNTSEFLAEMPISESCHLNSRPETRQD